LYIDYPKKPNPLGLYDIHGNVWEWVENTFWGPYPKGLVTDPKGLRGDSYRTFRGGGWSSDVRNLRSAARSHTWSWYHFSSLGFRLIRSVD